VHANVLPGLWSRGPGNFGWLKPTFFQVEEPEPEIWVPVQASHTNNTTLFLLFGLSYFGAGFGAKNLKMFELEPKK